VKATPGALKQAENLRSQAAMRKAALDNRLNDLARQIDGVELVFGRRASPTGKLFGSVTTSEIAEALNKKTGIDINRRRISQTTLREVGTHSVPVRLGSEISPQLRVIVVREEEYANFLKQQEAPQNPAEAVAQTAENVVETVKETVEHAAEAVAGVLSGAVEAVRGAISREPAEEEQQNAAE
jgi:large subunit ribosomal protein L9